MERVEPRILPEIAKRLGKRFVAEHMKWCGQVEQRVERDGEVVQEQRKIFDEEELVAYLLELYGEYSGYIAAGSHAFCRGLTIEDTMYDWALKYTSVLKSLGNFKAFSSGDFRHLYRWLAFSVRYEYGCEIHAKLLRGRGYAYASGVDHSTYSYLVESSFALMRPDWAKRFFPVELGPVARTHPSSKRMENLVIGLLHDDAAWKEAAYRDGRKFLEGKRVLSERALVSYLCNLYDGDTDGMSDDLATLMSVYHKSPWLLLPGGHCAAVKLFGYYLMAKFYLSERDFANLRRPSGPGWWDEYIDICLQDPLPAELCEPPILFPEPLGFFNTAVRWIEQGPPPGTVRLAMDIKEAGQAQ